MDDAYMMAMGFEEANETKRHSAPRFWRRSKPDDHGSALCAAGQTVPDALDCLDEEKHGRWDDGA